jgi:hypothetical protein
VTAPDPRPAREVIADFFRNPYFVNRDAFAAALLAALEADGWQVTRSRTKTGPWCSFTCRCGKTFWRQAWNAEEAEEGSPWRRLYAMSACRRCEMDSWRQRDACPEHVPCADDPTHDDLCFGSYEHTGPCATGVTRADQLDAHRRAAEVPGQGVPLVPTGEVPDTLQRPAVVSRREDPQT